MVIILKKQKIILNIAILSILFIGLLFSTNLEGTTEKQIESLPILPESSNFYFTNMDLISWVSTGDSTEPSVTIDSSGTTHIVWIDETDYKGIGTQKDIFYVNRSSTGVWGDIDVLTLAMNSPCVSPILIADNFDTLHLAFAIDDSPSGVYYMHRTSGVWSIIDMISLSGQSSDPDLVIDSSGNAHFVWQDTGNLYGEGTDEDILYRNLTSAGIKSNIQIVSSGSTSSGDSWRPSIDCDSDGNPHIVWYESDDVTGSSGSDIDIFYRNLTLSTGEWSSTELVSFGSSGMSAMPTIVLDKSTPIVHIAWMDFGDITGTSGSDIDIFYRNLTIGTDAWSSVEEVTFDSSNWVSTPEIQLDSNVLHIVYEEDAQVNYKNRSLNAANWELQQKISTETSSTLNTTPNMLILPTGLHQFVWGGDTTNYNSSGPDRDVYFKEINHLPVLTSPEDQNNLVTSTGNTITWGISDAYSVTDPSYTIVWNTSNVVTTDTWSNGGTITVDIDAFHVDLGEYNFTVIVDDGHGDNVTDSVYVTVYNIEPILTTSGDQNNLVTTTGHSISWEVTDHSITDPSYTIVWNTSNIVTMGTWSNGGTFAVDIDAFHANVGEYNFTVIVDDGYGDNVTSSVYVTVYNENPILTLVSDFSYGVGTDGNEIRWVVTDLSTLSQNYTVYKDSIQIMTDSWTSGVDIVIDIDSVDIGIYNYTIVVDDGFDSIVRDEVFVSAENYVPQISHPDDYSYNLESTGNVITWVITDVTNDGPTFTVFQNGTEFSDGVWISGENIVIDIDGLALGDYIFTIQADDGYGETIIDEVIVSVIEKSISFGYGALVIGVIATIGLVILIKKRVVRSNL